MMLIIYVMKYHGLISVNIKMMQKRVVYMLFLTYILTRHTVMILNLLFMTGWSDPLQIQ